MTPMHETRQTKKPTGLKVAPMSYANLEAAAKELNPLLPREVGRPHVICGWRVLEQTLVQAGYQTHVVENDDLKDCAAYTQPSQGLIVMRRDIYEGLHTGLVFSRSTVIHELAHIVLRHEITLHRGATPGAHQFFEDSEWQAKAMTAALMMPVEICEQYPTPIALAEACGTSVEAAGYRIQRLRSSGALK